MANRWITHLKKYRAAHKGVSLKQAMKQAKKTYKKDGNIVTGGNLSTGGRFGRLKTGGRIKRRRRKKKEGMLKVYIFYFRVLWWQMAHLSHCQKDY